MHLDCKMNIALTNCLKSRPRSITGFDVIPDPVAEKADALDIFLVELVLECSSVVVKLNEGMRLGEALLKF